MSNVTLPGEILKHTVALAKTDTNLEMMDCIAVLHGYVELSRFRPDDQGRRKEVEDAIRMLMKAAARYPRWMETLSNIVSSDLITLDSCPEEKAS